MPPTTETLVENLARRYDEAWNSHDPERILSMHTEDMVFQLHLPGFGEVSGEDALREHVGELFALWPDLEFRSHRLTACAGLFANQMTMAGTLAAPMPVGEITLPVTGRRVEFEAVDVIRLDGDHIKRKDTYVEAASLLAQLGVLGG